MKTAANLTRDDILGFRNSGNDWLGKVKLVKNALRGDRDARERIAYILNVKADMAAKAAS